MKKTVTALIVFLTVVLLVQAVGFAWMSDNGLSSPIDVTSNVHKAYFESGNGSKETPYVIATPLQLYYFAWLQYLGYFNLDEDNNNVIDDTVYFTLKNDIDMHVIDENGNPVDYVLPPIGTTDNPFLGNFDGAGFTVKNAIIENQYSSLIEPPNNTTEENFGGVEIIGFFGVVGSLPEDTYTYDSKANEVKNLVLENLTVKTQTTQSLIGLVAGYVNGVVDCVGVVGGTVNIKDGVTALSYTANISDYSLIGYCTDAFKNKVYVMDVVLSNPGITGQYTVVPEVGGDGDTTGWGGSVKMKDIFNLLQNMNTTTNNQYKLERTDVVSLDGKTVTVTSGANQSKPSATIADFGSFVFTDMTWNGNIINFVSGAQKVTGIKYAYTDKKNTTVYYITDDTNYLCFNGTNITNTTNRDDATPWYVSNGTNGGNIYTVVDGSVFYLTITNNTITTIEDFRADHTNLPTWSVSGNTYACNGSSITCVNGTWQIATGTNSGYVSANGNYLIPNGTNDVKGGSVNDASIWNITSVNGGYNVSTVINGTTYYLGYTSQNSGNWWEAPIISGPTLSTTASTWQFSNNQLYVRSSGNFGGATNYYLRWSGSDWTIDTGTSNATLQIDPANKIKLDPESELVQGIVWSNMSYIDNSLENYTYNESGQKVVTGAGITYMPLSFSTTNGYEVSKNNTGYIIGSQWGAIEKNEYDDNGNIRISRYGASNMSNYQTPLTMTYKTFNNGANRDFQTINATPSASHLATLGLQKYADCYKDFRTSITSDNNCYGLHFMQASVSMSNLTEITAYLKGEKKENYQMPTNCIDFRLYDRGFINFVAGSYYKTPTTNDSFFSIYEIVRDDNEKITAIKEIRKIYAKLTTSGDIDVGVPYIYTYSESDPAPEGYTMVFDCHWITNPNSYGNWDTDKAFYFEVPVNEGEYAIGSTAGRTGAYLVYLDLAANAQLIERHKEYEKIEENKTAATTPNGVELLAPSEGSASVNPSDSAFVSINTNTNGATAASGDITFGTTNGVTITHSATGGTSAEYIGNNSVLLDGKGNPMSLQGVVTTIERTTYRDYNINTRETIITVITKTTTRAADGSTTVLYSRTITTTDADGNVTVDETEPQAAELFPETKDTDTSPTVSVGADVINLYFAYGQEVGLTIEYLYIPAVKDANGNVTTAAIYQITITNPGSESVFVKAVLTEAGTKSGMTFTVNGTALENNTSAQTVEIVGTASSGDSTEGEGDSTEGEDPAA